MLAQDRERATYMRAGGALGTPEDLGDLAERLVFVVPQHHRGPLHSRELLAKLPGEVGVGVGAYGS